MDKQSKSCRHLMGQIATLPPFLEVEKFGLKPKSMPFERSVMNATADRTTTEFRIQSLSAILDEVRVMRDAAEFGLVRSELNHACDRLAVALAHLATPHKEVVMSHFQPHQQRVLDEMIALDIKRDALTKFIGSEGAKKIDPAELNRLTRQLEIMTMYSNLLAERIAAFA